jgi:hypothetical protein
MWPLAEYSPNLESDSFQDSPGKMASPVPKRQSSERGSGVRIVHRTALACQMRHEEHSSGTRLQR